MGRMILFRSEVRRKKLELFNKPSMLTKEGVDGMKEEVRRCKEWEVAIQGWRQHLEYSEEQKREEERVETGEGGPGGGRGHHAPGGRARRGPHLSLLPAGLQQSR